MKKTHFYQVKLEWTGNSGRGTENYRSYERSHKISAPGKNPIFGSSDPAFRGDRTLYNPEEMLVASISACHMLWFLHLAAENDIVVVNYEDNPEGILQETENGGGSFEKVILKPIVWVNKKVEEEWVNSLHHKANQLCFIANSVKFPILHTPALYVA